MSKLKVGDFAWYRGHPGYSLPPCLVVVIEDDRTTIPYTVKPLLIPSTYPSGVWDFAEAFEKIELEQEAPHAPAAATQDNVPQPQSGLSDAR